MLYHCLCFDIYTQTKNQNTVSDMKIIYKRKTDSLSCRSYYGPCFIGLDTHLWIFEIKVYDEDT